MAFTKVTGAGILTTSNYEVGIITATKFVGPMDGFSGNVNAGFGTFANDLRVDGNFIVNGDYTTLNTTLREVEILRVDANTAASVAAGIITQAGAGDIINLFDGTTEVLTVTDGGKIGIGTTNPSAHSWLHIYGTNSHLQLRVEKEGVGSFNHGVDSDGAFLETLSGDNIPIRFYAGGGEKMRLTSAGRVGITSTVPTAPLNVQAENSTGTCVRLNQEETNKKASIYFQDATTTDNDSWITNEGYDLTVYAGYGGKLNLGAYLTTGITVFSTGKVGVGTTTSLNAGSMTLYSDNAGEGTATGQLELKDTGAYDSTPTGGIIFSGHHTAGSQAIFSGIRGFKANTGDGDYDGCLGFDVRKHGAVAYEAMRINEDAQIIKQRDSTNRTNLKTYTANDAFLIDHYQYQSGSTYRRYIDLVAGGSGNHGSIIRLFTMPDSTDSSGVPTERFRITEAGKVCINTGTPGGANADDFTIAYNENETSDAGRAGMTIRSSTTQRGYIYFADGTSGDNPHRGQIQYEHNGDEFQIGAAGYMQLKIKEAGIEPTDYLQQTNDYPDFRPTLDLNFAAVKKLDPRITYERTGLASYTDEFGIVRVVGANTPRFDHDPVTKECKGLLIEGSATNYVLDSKMLTGWSFGVGTDVFTASSGSQLSTNPDGSSPAYHYVPSSASGHHRYNETVTVPTLDTNYVVSVFVKRVTAGTASTLNQYVELEVTGNFNGNSAGTGQSGSDGGSHVVYDLQNLTIHNGQSDNDRGYVGDSKLEDYGNGWYRCSYVFNPGSGSNSTGTIWWGHPSATAGDSGSETGNGSPSFYFWGASVEKGNVLTSYIPTNGSTVTRGNDIVRIMDDDFTDIFGTEFENFSVVADFDNSNSFDGNNASILEWWSDNNNYEDRIQIMKDDSSPYHIETRAFGNDSAIFSNGNLEASSKAATNRLATSWSVDYSTNDAANRRWAFSFSGEAVDVVGDATGTTVPALTRFGIGCSPYKLDLTRGVLLFKRLMVYNKTLSDNQLQTLTS